MALRIGRVEEVVNRTSDTVTGTIQGAWDGFLASVATIMDYYQQTHHVLSKSGQALAAWPNPEVHVHPPSCETFTQHMDDPQRLHSHNFFATLFTAGTLHVRLPGTVPPAVYRRLQRGHLVYGKATLLQWDKAVQDDWALKNMASVDKASDLGPLVLKLQQESIAVKEQNVSLASTVVSLGSKISEVSSTSALILQAVTFLASGGGDERTARYLTCAQTHNRCGGPVRRARHCCILHNRLRKAGAAHHQLPFSYCMVAISCTVAIGAAVQPAHRMLWREVLTVCVGAHRTSREERRVRGGGGELRGYGPGRTAA
jgi:hypothetical protein